MNRTPAAFYWGSISAEGYVLLLYIDESGDVANADQHFVVGGVAIHEADADRMRSRAEGILRRHLSNPALHQLELHAQAIRSGRGEWRGVPAVPKERILRDVPKLLGSFGTTTALPYALFAVVKAPGSVPSADPLERTFEELLLKFTEMLVRRRRLGDNHLGLVVGDEAKYERLLQPLVSLWRERGTRVRQLKQLVEVPLFADSRATRLLQLADFVAHGVYRRYEHDDDALFGPMLAAFDQDRGVIHGLTHLTRRHKTCPCPGCESRRWGV